jgi:hypothetical protein
MTIKEMKKYIAYPRVKKNKSNTFFELIKKNMILGKKGEKKRTLSLDVDKIVYGQ